MGLGIMILSACSVEAEAPRLDTLVITDPSFDFSTSRSASLVLNSGSGAPAALEVRDAEGRRLMKGAFAVPAVLDLRLPVGTEPRLTIRQGQGAAATEQTVQLDADGQATANF